MGKSGEVIYISDMCDEVAGNEGEQELKFQEGKEGGKPAVVQR